MSYKCVCGCTQYAKRQRLSEKTIYNAEHEVVASHLNDKKYAQATRCFCTACDRDVTPRVLADKGERPPIRERQSLVESMNKAIDENFEKDPKLKQDCIDAASEYLDHRLHEGGYYIEKTPCYPNSYKIVCHHFKNGHEAWRYHPSEEAAEAYATKRGWIRVEEKKTDG